MRVLIVDGANVVGSRPDGWWRARAGAAQRLHDALVAAELGYDLVVLVLEGDDVVVVTADRGLRERVATAGGSCVGPSWLLGQVG